MSFRSASVATRGGLGLRIHGALNARGKVTQFRVTTKQKIAAVIEQEGPNSLERIRARMDAHFSRDEGSGRAAKSLKGEVFENPNQVGYRIKIKDFREVKFFTTLVTGSRFKPGPYSIVAKGKFLRFFWKHGPSGPGIYRTQQVIHPGFGTDILRDAGETELSRIGNVVEMRVRSAVAEVFSGERILRPSGRR